jgi:thioesterase domain-containing protein
MAVEVVAATAERVQLAAPLAPNINHRETVFGGSASALAILAAWAVLTLRLQQEGIDCRVVIQRNTMQYLRPIVDRFTATAAIADETAWEKFADMLRRKGRARITLGATLRCRDEVVGELSGDFVAVKLR